MKKKEVVDKYKLQLNQFPRILKDDPVSRYYGMTVGQLVELLDQANHQVGMLHIELLCNTAYKIFIA